MKAVLDASVLYPTVLREILQGAGEAGLYQPVFSDRILREWVLATAKLGPAAPVIAQGEAATLRVTFPRGLVREAPQIEARLILPCRARVSIVGALNRQQADALVSRLLGRLPAGDAAACAPLPAVGEVAPLQAPAERRIPFDSAQAHVLIGQPGYKRDDPDYFALLVGNYTLGGGGFVSRLTQEVREKRGLSYSVYSYFSPGLHAGAFTIGLQTRPDQAAQALKVSRDVLAAYVAEGPTPEELKAAKDNLIGGFALRLDSNRKLLDNVANICLLYTSPSPRDRTRSRMPSSA